MHIVPRNKHGITGMRRVDQLGELRRNLAISARLGCSAGGGGFQPRLALNPSHQTVLLGRQLANCPRPRNGRENRPHRRRPHRDTGGGIVASSCACRIGRDQCGAIMRSRDSLDPRSAAGQTLVRVM